MDSQDLQTYIGKSIENGRLDINGNDKDFYQRLNDRFVILRYLYNEIYGYHDAKDVCFQKIITSLIDAYLNRSETLKKNDDQKLKKGNWFLSNEITGMSLYVDRFCGKINNMTDKLPYLQNLGVNLLHLMPLFESPEGESDGGYAVSDFRKVDKKYGTLEELIALRNKMNDAGMYLMLDIVLNHTSHKHEWALKAKRGEKEFQDYYYFYDNLELPQQYDQTMPEIFPESAPGNFTYIHECNKWVMTVFHNYQWDLNYTNPAVLSSMLDNIFFYANLGVDILRIDAPAFIWKELGTSCQNLPKAHTILRFIKACVEVATPGMALLGEAIVAPKEIMKYFGTGDYVAKECDFAYNATQMALQWDMLATGDVRVMLAAQHDILQKPFGTSWITYTRCHDDIGLGYEDETIRQAGFDPYHHRLYLKEYYSGNHQYSVAIGALFSSNPKTGDARISGTLASLCGLEKAMYENNQIEIYRSIDKILLMQAHSFFIGGIPMIFYGDEVGYTNDYSFQNDPAKSYDNRWMHRPAIDWNKNEMINQAGSIEAKVFNGTKKLISIRKNIEAVSDLKNLVWLYTENKHIAGYIRTVDENKLYCLFNFSVHPTRISWHVFKRNGFKPSSLFDCWSERTFNIGHDHEYLEFAPYQFYIFEAM